MKSEKCGLIQWIVKVNGLTERRALKLVCTKSMLDFATKWLPCTSKEYNVVSLWGTVKFVIDDNFSHSHTDTEKGFSKAKDTQHWTTTNQLTLT